MILECLAKSGNERSKRWKISMYARDTTGRQSTSRLSESGNAKSTSNAIEPISALTGHRTRHLLVSPGEVNR